MPSLSSCPNVQLYTTREIAKLNLAIARITQGLDPASALEAAKDAVLDDMTTNAARISKAAAEGIGSEFTQDLLNGVMGQVLDEIISNLPAGAARSIAERAKTFNEITFSMIQLIIQLSDKSPLIMASKAKESYIEAVEERDRLIISSISLCEELRTMLSRVERMTSSDDTIGAKVDKSLTGAISELEEADKSLLNIQIHFGLNLISQVDIENARTKMTAALHLLSPLDKKMDGQAISTNDELIDALNSGYSDTDIIIKISLASLVNSFKFDTDSITTLRNEGMSTNVERVFTSIKSFPRIEDPVQIVWKKVKNKISELNKVLQKLEEFELVIPQILTNYLSIKSSLDSPKIDEVHSKGLYERAISSCRNRLSTVIGAMETTSDLINAKARPLGKEFSTSSVGDWIAQIAVSITVLDIVKNGMYEEKRINSTPLNSYFYKSYERSVDSFSSSSLEWGNDDKRSANLSFRSGIFNISAIIGTSHAILVSKDSDDAKRLLLNIDKEIKMLSSFKALIDTRTADSMSHLIKYSPEPETPKVFDKLFEMIKSLGFDRLYDMISTGQLEDVLNMDIDLASYVGAASRCLSDLAENATNEYDRARFSKASLELGKKERSRSIGKVNVSMRSVQAVKQLKIRIEEIMSMVKNIFEVDFKTKDNSLTDGLFPSPPNL